MFEFNNIRQVRIRQDVMVYWEKGIRKTLKLILDETYVLKTDKQDNIVIYTSNSYKFYVYNYNIVMRCFYNSKIYYYNVKTLIACKNSGALSSIDLFNRPKT